MNIFKEVLLNNAQELINWDKEHLLYGISPVGQNLGRIFESARGIIIKDIDGKEYIDCASQLTCVNLGYSQREITTVVAEQMSKLPYSTLFFGYSHVPSIECGKKLAELTPEGLDHFFFTSGGSDSVEVAIKLARQYWHSQGKNKYKIISLYNGYHGTHFGALSATTLNKGIFDDGIIPKVPGFLHIPPYYCFHCFFGLKYPECQLRCATFLSEIIESEGSESIAAFIAEAVMGSGGMIPPPPEYWPLVRKVCTDHNVLLIDDEVMAGFCRTGKMFALEHWKLVPDMITMAKGITSSYLPFGAVAVNKQIFDGLKGKVPTSYTYSGHPVCCAAAIKTMEIYLRDKIADNASKVGRHMLNRINNEFTKLPCVAEATGLGLQMGIEIVENKKTKKIFDPSFNLMGKIQNQAFDKGLLIRVGSNRVELTPPLIITIAEADKALDILKTVLAGIKPA